MFTWPKCDFSRRCHCPGTRKPLGGNFGRRSSWRTAEIGLLDPGRLQFLSLGILPSENGQIPSHLERGPHLGPTPNSHFRGCCPLFPRARRQLPNPVYAGVHHTGAPSGHIYRHPRPGSPPLGVWPEVVVRGVYAFPIRAPGRVPRHPEARS
jgi:hypothetical protein